MTTPRIQRWPLLLAGYDYEIPYQHGSKSGNPDGLSGLHLVDTVAQAPVIDDAIVLMEQLEVMAVCADYICRLDCYRPYASPSRQNISSRLG